MKFKVGDYIHCMCQSYCGCQGEITEIVDSIVFFKDGMVEPTMAVNEYWVDKETYELMKNSPLAKALNEPEN
jgi:hypothetical protein